MRAFQQCNLNKLTYTHIQESYRGRRDNAVFADRYKGQHYLWHYYNWSMVNGTRISPGEEEGDFCNGSLATEAWVDEVVSSVQQDNLNPREDIGRGWIETGGNWKPSGYQTLRR